MIHTTASENGWQGHVISSGRDLGTEINKTTIVKFNPWYMDRQHALDYLIVITN